MRAFDYQDFNKNPMKYRSFKTAVIAANIFTHNGEHDLPQGQCVALQYRGEAFNAMYRRTEPIYAIDGTDRTLYANALADFVL